MNILTFDIEDWYNCDFLTPDLNWDRYEVRIYKGVERILEELETHQLKATFFCLGWIAEKHPKVIRSIYKSGHHIGCHSYQHELVFNLTKETFRQNTEKAKKIIEDILGIEIDAYRAPGFSIIDNTQWAFAMLAELGFKYDCSVFPAMHDYGGLANYNELRPAILQVHNGMQIKEFPLNTHEFMRKKIVFSGGGFFRMLPYPLIKEWAEQAAYLMTYFHPRDFDPDQPIIKSLPPMRKFKSYVGLKKSFGKLQKLLNDFDFINLQEADRQVDWDKAKRIEVKG
jgi:polysaccharide deacetylase family protein (PEP-CTERM system associated)